MKKKYRNFILLVIFLTLLSTIFTTIFCFIYSKSVPGWFQGGVIGFFIDVFIVSISIPIIKSTVRILIRQHWIFKPLIIIDYSFFLLNFIL